MNLSAEEHPRVSWKVTWTAAFAVLLLSLVVGESAWRSLGYCPSAVDSPALWTFWYNRAVCGGPRTIVFIGSSRIQAGISMNVIRNQFSNYHVVQLAQYASGSPIAVLRALAFDERFKGIVICDTIEPFLVRKYWEEQRDLVEHIGGLREGVEALLSASVRDHFAIRSTKTGLEAALKQLANNGRLPLSGHVRMRADRSLEYDFSGQDNLEPSRKQKAELYRSRYEAEQFPTPEEFDIDVRYIERFVQSIQARGGEVVFVRMPSSGERLALEEEFHPKAKYWDQFAERSSGICIHSAELADVRGVKCPDDSHLDYSDATRFTIALANELLQRGVLSMQ